MGPTACSTWGSVTDSSRFWKPCQGSGTLLLAGTTPADLNQLAGAGVKRLSVMGAGPATTASGVSQAGHHPAHDG